MQSPPPVQPSPSILPTLSSQPPPSVQPPALVQTLPSQSQASQHSTQAAPVTSGVTNNLIGYQALGSLMGGFPDFAIYRKFSNIGALDLIYRQAELENCISRWADIAIRDRKSSDPPLKLFDIKFNLLWNAQHSDPHDTKGDQWRMWTEVSEKLVKFCKYLQSAP